MSMAAASPAATQPSGPQLAAIKDHCLAQYGLVGQTALVTGGTKVRLRGS
jgi:hypothetical protein